MKVKIPWLKIFLMWLIIFLVMAVIVFFMFFNLFLQQWSVIQPIIIAIYVLVMVAILMISINTHYYEINKKDITEAKFGKKFVYFYNDIIYIDEQESLRTKTLCFVTNRGHVKYLTFDKEGKIFKAATTKCNNLISLEEVKSRFPGIKI